MSYEAIILSNIDELINEEENADNNSNDLNWNSNRPCSPIHFHSIARITFDQATEDFHQQFFDNINSTATQTKEITNSES